MSPNEVKALDWLNDVYPFVVKGYETKDSLLASLYEDEEDVSCEIYEVIREHGSVGEASFSPMYRYLIDLQNRIATKQTVVSILL